MISKLRLLLTTCIVAAPLAAVAAEPASLFETIPAPAHAALTPMADAAQMSITLALPLRDLAGAKRLLADISDPASASYGKFLTPAEFGARFGADSDAYEHVRSWAISQGLAVGARNDSRTILPLTGTARQFGALFHTRFATFNTPLHGDGRVMLVKPSLPAELAGRISGVVGLASAGRYAPLARISPDSAKVANSGTGIGGYYSPTDIRKAYDIPAQTSSAKTEVVGIFEQGGYSAADITTYENQYGVNVPQTLVSVNGAGTGKNVFVEIEDVLDIDAIMGTNPNASNIRVYIDGKDTFQVALLDALNQMAQDHLSTTISISYGQDEVTQGTPAILAEGTAFMQLAMQGQTVFVSSGDDGSGGRTGGGTVLNAPDPGSQPYVVSVGGTTLTLDSSQNYLSETVWDGTGGGVSSVWAIPSYQIVKGKSVAIANGGSATMRNVPDIAAVADPNTGYSMYCRDYGGWIGVGGTSLSAPIWGGMTSVANANRVAAGGKRLGFLNPLLYKAGIGGKGFHDITVGSNGTPLYSAGPGYDNTTGFGSIDLGILLKR